ncbi:polysaccharide deacetylase family protein [Bacillus sp. FJAT-29937]|uniref:polysaccharide deacetylase family protein n=1 Tax=Bacillus sp. FJAT-29937 TaxID=1720553 RepID=UPI0008360326|nr:polysaccharide deacetylase family protein [Bacillus sp. FJAT-29937]
MMELQKIEIFVDGFPLETPYYYWKSAMMVPALLFKHFGAFVEFNEVNGSIIFQSEEKIFTLFNKKVAKGTSCMYGNSYVPFFHVAKKLGMNIEIYENTIFVHLNSTNCLPVMYKGETVKKLVALTFDDGPASLYAPKILDILKEKKISATFFVIGDQVNMFPHVIKRIQHEGHAIGNHTWSHPNLLGLTTSQLLKELQLTDEVIFAHTGIRSTLFRPPYGYYAKSDLQIISKAGYKVIMWSIDTVDWSGIQKEEIIEKVNMEESPGAIILQHCFGTTTGVLEGTVRALPFIIDNLLKKGYEFVTIDQFI